MAIPIQEARGIFTKTLMARWNELSEIEPKNFLRSFFTKKTTTSKEISIEVMRGTEKIAVDVLRGNNGNRNTFSKHAEKILVPPFFNEYFDLTELDRYDLLYGQDATNPTVGVITGMIDQALEKLNILKYKIERAYELQCAQVFTSGIVQLTNGDNVDYKRKAASMVVKDQADYWSVDAVDPRSDFITGAEFLRKTGKATDGEFNVILGSQALIDLLANPFIDNDKIKTLPLIELQMPQTNSMGGVYHGTLSAGAYKVHLWSYPEYYDNASGVSTAYVDSTYMFMLPKNSGKFVMSFAGVPAIIRDQRNAEFPEYIRQMEADYFINNYIDPFGKKHVFEILSAGLAVPVSVDRIYSSQVTGTAIPQN